MCRASVLLTLCAPGLQVVTFSLCLNLWVSMQYGHCNKKKLKRELQTAVFLYSWVVYLQTWTPGAPAVISPLKQPFQFTCVWLQWYTTNKATSHDQDEPCTSSSPPPPRVHWSRCASQNRNKTASYLCWTPRWEKFLVSSPCRVLSHPLQTGSATASCRAHSGPGQERFTDQTEGFSVSKNPRSSAALRSHWMSSASPHSSALYSPTHLRPFPPSLSPLHGNANSRWLKMQPMPYLPLSFSLCHSLTHSFSHKPWFANTVKVDAQPVHKAV